MMAPGTFIPDTIKNQIAHFAQRKRLLYRLASCSGAEPHRPKRIL